MVDTNLTSGDMTTPRRRGARGPPAWQQGGASMPSPPSNITTTVPERRCRFPYCICIYLDNVFWRRNWDVYLYHQ